MTVFGKASAWVLAMAVFPSSVAAQDWVEVRTPHF